MVDSLTQLRREQERAIRKRGDELLIAQPRLGFEAYAKAHRELGCRFELIEATHMRGPDFVLGIYDG